jgi:hypothetical protein
VREAGLYYIHKIYMAKMLPWGFFITYGLLHAVARQAVARQNAQVTGVIFKRINGVNETTPPYDK